MKKTTAIQAMLTGMGIGFPATILCMLLLGGSNPVIREFLVWAVASALYGLLSYLLFENQEGLGLPAALGLHCLGCAAITAAAVMICGYVQHLGQFLAAILPVFAVIYILAHAIIYGCTKLEEKKINRALDQK